MPSLQQAPLELVSNLAPYFVGWKYLSRGVVEIGVNDTTQGILRLLGAGAGSDEGGELQLYTAADHDATYNFWRIDAQQDDLLLGTSLATRMTLAPTDTVTIGDGSGSQACQINGAASAVRDVRLQTAGVDRWILRANSTAESGSNAGSNFELLARADNGNALSTPISITRSTGAVAVAGAATLSALLTTQAGITNTGAISHTGTTAFPTANLTLANGDNNDVALPANATYVRATGPTAAFAITGIAGGVDGRMLTIAIPVAQTVTIKNLNGSSTAANQIRTHTAGDLVLGINGMVELVYDGASSFWRVRSARGASGAF